MDDRQARLRLRRASRSVALAACERAPSRARGSHGGYERRISIPAPLSRASDSSDARTPSSAAAFELRVIDPSVSTPSSVSATVRHVLVSTVRERPAASASTPVGTAASRSRACSDADRSAAPSAVGRRERELEAVVRAAVRRRIAASSASAALSGTTRTRLRRPRRAHGPRAGLRFGSRRRRCRRRPNGTDRYAAESTRPSALTAFARPARCRRPSARPGRRRARRRRRAQSVVGTGSRGQRKRGGRCGRSRRSRRSALRRSSRRG